MKNLFSITLVVLCTLALGGGCSKTENQPAPALSGQTKSVDQEKSTSADIKRKITFIELGSVNCIPCRMMQPVMAAIEEEFGEQIEVVFYDVWKDSTPAQQYRIRVIPTQVFLDESGNEFFRHEGFFPKEAIESLLVNKGLKLLKTVEIEGKEGK